MSTTDGFVVRMYSRGSETLWSLQGPDGKPVAEVEKFLRTVMCRGLSARTRRTYCFDLLCAYRWMAAADLQPPELVGENFLEFVAFQQRPPRAAASTINRRLRLLHRFVDFLTGTPPVIPVWQYRNHAQGFHGPARHGSLRLKEPHRVIQPIKDAQFLAFFGSLRTWRDRAITLLMWGEGLRSMEVLNLATGDVDFQQRSLRIEGKGNKQRVMPLADVVANALLLYLRLERPKSSSASLVLVLKGPRRDRPLTLAGLRRIFRYHRKKSGVGCANPHRFRHSFGTNMTRARVSLLALAKMMGHSSPQTTMRYVEIEDEELRTLYFQALESLLPEDLLDE